MKDDQETQVGEVGPNDSPWAIRIVCICGLVLVVLFLVLNWLSPPFEYRAKLRHPFLEVTGLLIVGGVVSFFGLISALKVPQQQRKPLLWLIVCFALSTRLIAVFTCPILELDYYRYLWDGKVVAAGVSPFLYSPEQVLKAGSKSSKSETLAKLNELSLRSKSNHTILSRIHFEDHTTIYPPVSQAVFALAMKWIPDSYTVDAHIVIMKLVLVLFDVGTLLLIYFLLRKLGFSVGWLIVYAWNPLVIKEIANGGHLDSIATFFMFTSVFLLVRWQLSNRTKIGFLIASAIALGLGVGAKLFPVVLLPALAVYISRTSWAQAGMFSFLFATVTLVTLWPMLHPIIEDGRNTEVQSSQAGKEPLTSLGSAALADLGKESASTDAKQGAVGFFTSWRVNDTAFSFVYLNLKDSKRAAKAKPWFVFTSNDFRKRFESWCRDKSVGGSNPAFSAAKVLTLITFSIFYCWQLFALWRKPQVQETTRNDCVDLLQRSAMILTVFLFLQPTVNPWYFVWVMPLACFSNNRGWLLASGLLLTYYSRFWFKSLDGSFLVFGREYSGSEVYSYDVVWTMTAIVIAIFVYFATSKSRDKNDFELVDSVQAG